MGNPIRLPIQHRRRPHCATCGAALPTLEGMVLTLPEETDVITEATVVAVSVHVLCSCGSEWLLKKETK